MAKYLEKAMVCQAIERDSKDGKYKNTSVRLYELDTFRGEIVEMKVKPEELNKWRAIEGKIITSVILDEYTREGVSGTGKPYRFVDFILKSFVPSKSLASAA
jgi:hypothetical protein